MLCMCFVASRSNSKTQSFRLFGVDVFDNGDISGVLEVFEDSRWGMVCTNSSEEEGNHLAKIICRTLQLKDFPNAKIISIPPKK